MGEVILGVDFRRHEKPVGPLDAPVLVFADEDTAPSGDAARSTVLRANGRSCMNFGIPSAFAYAGYVLPACLALLSFWAGYITGRIVR